jgi:hypothetical protein
MSATFSHILIVTKNVKFILCSSNSSPMFLWQTHHHHLHLAFREIGHCWPVVVSFFQEHDKHWTNTKITATTKKTSCLVDTKSVNHVFYLFVAYLMTPSQYLRLYSIEWENDRQMMNCKGFGRKRSWPNWRYWRKPQKTPFRIASLQAKIWTWDLPNTKQKC